MDQSVDDLYIEALKIFNAETNTDSPTLFINQIKKGGEQQITMPQFIDDTSKYDIPSGSGNFLKLEDGANKLRLCTKPLEIVYHEVGGEKYSTTVCPGNGCDQCKAGKPKKYKYGFLVLNRKDSKPYIYEAPVTVFRQIVAYETNVEYGDIRKYDITINKSGIARNTTYTIMPSPKKSELTPEETKQIAESGVSLEATYNLK